jgi:hypothetical protein
MVNQTIIPIHFSILLLILVSVIFFLSTACFIKLQRSFPSDLSDSAKDALQQSKSIACVTMIISGIVTILFTFVFIYYKPITSNEVKFSGVEKCSEDSCSDSSDIEVGVNFENYSTLGIEYENTYEM